MKKLTLHRETLYRDLAGAQGGMPVGTTRIGPEPATFAMTCALSCMRNCDFTTRIPL